MSSKNYTRQGFGGNYRRNGETSPVKPPTTLFPQQQQEGEGKQQQQNNNSMDSVKQQGYPPKYEPPMWSVNNRTRFFSAKPYTSPTEQQTPPPSILSQSQDSEQPTEESPSVRSVVKNFEGHHKTHATAPQVKDPITRTKVSELRETLVRKSNEDLHKASHEAENATRDIAITKETVSTPSTMHVTSATVTPGSRDHQTFTPVRVVDMSPPHYTPPPIPTDIDPSPPHKTPPAPKEKPKRKSTKSRRSHQPQPQVELTPPQNSPMNLQINTSEEAPPLPAKKSVGATPPTPTSPPPVDEPVITPQKAEQKPVNISLVDKLSESPKSESAAPKKQSALTSSHVRQKSMEEIACEKQAALVVKQLGEEERQLCEVILPPPEHKTTTDYINGLFDTSVDMTRRLSIQVKREKKTAWPTEQEKDR